MYRGIRKKARVSRMTTSYCMCNHAFQFDRPRGSLKVGFRMVLVLRSDELGRTAYMGVQPTYGTLQVSHSSRSYS
jgi:hypothetical protein